MQAKGFPAPHFEHGGRGPSLVHWIYDRDNLFPGSQSPESSEPPGDIVGAHFGHELALSWVIFHGLQVIQIVPEEVHSYWFLHYRDAENVRSCLWEIEDSTWLASFHPRHLRDKGYKHYVLVFYDELVEVICRELIFGEGRFDIGEVVNKDARFNYAYLRYAEAQEELGNLGEAVEYYQKYIDSNPDNSAAEFAQNCIDAILTESAED